MDWADYLRDQAAKYWQLAETAEASVKEELLDLAATCEEADLAGAVNGSRNLSLDDGVSVQTS